MTRGRELPLVLLFFAILAYALAPFTFGDKRVSVPRDHELDAVQECLLVADGMHKLLTRPLTYYDTAILYPDRNQLRSTEPFLGFALVGLPLRTILRLNDVDVFEALRWLAMFGSLTYGYLFYKSIGIGAAISVAGAVLCVSMPDLLNGIERLQIICIPLILAVVYHGVMASGTGRSRAGHRIGLFVSAALYPLCGAINATVAIVAALCVLPWLLRILAELRRERRLAPSLVPLLLAVALDALVLAPWMLDRSDMAVYLGREFLEVKHWNPTLVPARLQDIPGFVVGQAGLGLLSAAVLLGAWSVTHAIDRRRNPGAPSVSLPRQRYLLVVVGLATALVVSTMFESGRLMVPWLNPVFQAACFATLLWYWREQWLAPSVDHSHRAAQRVAVTLSAGLGVFLYLASFGPVYATNTSPLATNIVRVLLSIVTPLKSIREFHRVAMFGVLFVSVFVTVRLGLAMRDATSSRRLGVAVTIVVAALFSEYNRALVASPDIEAPREFVDLASHSRGHGAVYVHPYMKWNSMSGVLMIASANELRRPIVNGYLGIAPPWFMYATKVLHRFPDAEAVWLLRKWNVETVVSLAGDVGAERAVVVHKTFGNSYGVVWDLDLTGPVAVHPSAGEQRPLQTGTRIDAPWTVAPHDEPGMLKVTVKVPRGFMAAALEVSFRQSVIDQTPDEIGVYAFDGARGMRLNRDHSGEWIDSLVADALLQRESPVATVTLSRTEGDLQVEFRHSEHPPIERIVLIGESTR